MADLDTRRTEILGRSASIIQRKVRSYLAKKAFIQLRSSATRIQAVCRGIYIFCLLDLLVCLCLSSKTNAQTYASLSVQVFLLEIHMKACAGKLLLWKSRETCEGFWLGKLTLGCFLLLFQFKRLCVVWFLEKNCLSEGRLKLQQ